MPYEVIEVTFFKISVNLTSKASASAASEVIDVTFANILVKSNYILTASLASEVIEATTLKVNSK